MRKLIGVLYIVLVIPAGFFALLSRLCDSPYGCYHSPLDYAIGAIIVASPILFILGAIGGWLPESKKRVGTFLMFLPLLPLILIVGFTIFMFSIPLFNGGGTFNSGGADLEGIHR